MKYKICMIASGMMIRMRFFVILHILAACDHANPVFLGFANDLWVIECWHVHD